MNASSTQALITGAVTDVGAAALVILTAVIGLGVAYFVFRWGWRRVKGSFR